MKGHETTFQRACSPGSKHHTHSRSLVAVACLVIGSSLLSGCAVGAAVGALTAVTQAGVLVETVLDTVRYAHEQVSLIVENETEVYAGPGEEYPRIATLHEGTEIKVLAHQGDWIECCCDECGDGWIHCPCVSDM
jgi:hypothetical protein